MPAIGPADALVTVELFFIPGAVQSRAPGLLVDLHRTFGVYAHFGETVAFVRWFRVELDFGVGMQARFP